LSYFYISTQHFKNQLLQMSILLHPTLLRWRSEVMRDSPAYRRIYTSSFSPSPSKHKNGPTGLFR
jgi:hypothetical protein